MYFTKCKNRKALHDEIKEFLTDSEAFYEKYPEANAEYSLEPTPWTMGSLRDHLWTDEQEVNVFPSSDNATQDEQPEFDPIAEDCYGDACLKATELYGKDPYPPRPPVGLTDPVKGLRCLMLWCVEPKPKRANRKPSGRPPVSPREAKKRRALVSDWESTHESGLTKDQFCEDREGIDVTYLDVCVRWCRDHPGGA